MRNQSLKLRSLRYFLQVSLMGIAIFFDFFGTNQHFFIFLVSFSLTFLNVQRVFGLVISLPLTVVLFFGLQLFGLLVSPWLTSVVSFGTFSKMLLVTPFLGTLALKNRDYRKNVREFKVATMVDIAVVILPTILSLGLFLKSISKYPNGWSFWALGGDSRNFLVHSISTVNSNGLTGPLLAKGPAFPSSLVGLLNPDFSQGSNFSSFFQIIALLQFLFLALSSILLAFFARQLFAKVKLRNPIIILIISALPFSGLYSGVLQRDGFFGISTLFPIFLSLLILLMEILDKDAPINTRLFAYFSGSLILPILVLLTWTPFLIFAIMYIYFGYRAFNDILNRYRKIIIAIFFINLTLIYYCLKPLVNSMSADSQLTSRGAITPPNMVIFLSVLLYFVYNIKIEDIKGLRIYVMNKILIFFSLGGLVNLLFIGIQPFDAKWNYYPSKYGWVWLVASFPLVIVIFWMNVSKVTQKKEDHLLLKWGKENERVRNSSIGAIATSFSLIFLYFVQPPVPSPWIQPWFNAMAKGQFGVYSQVLNGWASPSPEAIVRINSINVSNRQPMFFKYFINPSDDRMSNFLLVLNSIKTDGNRTPIGDKLTSYAYFADPTDLNAICEFVDGSQKDLTILTKSRSFMTDLESKCKLNVDNLEVLIEN